MYFPHEFQLSRFIRVAEAEFLMEQADEAGAQFLGPRPFFKPGPNRCHKPVVFHVVVRLRLRLVDAEHVP